MKDGDIRGVVAITGAARGIGRGIARRLARDGYAVAISDIDSDGVQGVAREIVEAGGRADAEQIDVTDAEAVSDWVDRVDAQPGGLTGAVGRGPQTWPRSLPTCFRTNPIT